MYKNPKLISIKPESTKGGNSEIIFRHNNEEYQWSVSYTGNGNGHYDVKIIKKKEGKFISSTESKDFHYKKYPYIWDLFKESTKYILNNEFGTMIKEIKDFCK